MRSTHLRAQAARKQAVTCLKALKVSRNLTHSGRKMFFAAGSYRRMTCTTRPLYQLCQTGILIGVLSLQTNDVYNTFSFVHLIS